MRSWVSDTRASRVMRSCKMLSLATGHHYYEDTIWSIGIVRIRTDALTTNSFVACAPGREHKRWWRVSTGLNVGRALDSDSSMAASNGLAIAVTWTREPSGA